MEKAAEELKEKLQGDDLEAINTAKDALNEAMQGAAAEAYQAASNEEGDEAQAKAAPEGDNEPEDKQEDGPVVDAEVVDEDKK